MNPRLRATLLRLQRLPVPAQRTFTTTPQYASSPFNSGPAPPRLPKEEQEIFERLQRQSTGAFSTPRDDSTPSSPAAVASSPARARMQINQSPDSAQSSSSPEQGQQVDEESLVHPDLRRGVKPEFEGDVNPKTGEVGGPKTEPLRWGAKGDWSYGGRVTDF